MNAIRQFKKGLEDNLAGSGAVAVSACTAHPLVLRALFQTALEYDTFALIESTSNQVDQYGGYTGLKPSDFVRLVHNLASEEGFPSDRVLLGGDHLGTNTWRHMPSEKAQKEAKTLVAEYARAGYKKFHLDAGFICADDKGPLAVETVATRCAKMAQVCEANAAGDPPLYVVGTEVPSPGGALCHGTCRVTAPEDVEISLSAFKAAFFNHHLEAAWERVVALVVHPGVEFGDNTVQPYTANPALSAAILNQDGMVFEAHSTDYQSGHSLKQMVRDHYYILKVGPWLTYTLRESLYSLELIEQRLNIDNASHFRNTLLEVMQANPEHWKDYYRGSPEEVTFKLDFSYSDRARYYLGHAKVLAAQKQLLENLGRDIPEDLIRQIMPVQYARLHLGDLTRDPWGLVLDKIRTILELYLDAEK